MALTTPPPHFRSQSERQRLEVLRRLDVAEFEAMQADSSMTPDHHRLRTDAPKPTLRVVQPGYKPQEPSVCGFGVCEMRPECTSSCRYRAAEKALRGVLPQQAERLDAPEELHFPRPVPARSLALAALIVLGAWLALGLLVKLVASY